MALTLVDCVEKDGKRYYYVDVGDGLHGKTSFRLWISAKLVENGKVDLEGKRKIVKTEKGNYVLTASDDKYVFCIGWKCGFRGESYYTILEPEKVLVELPFVVYSSPRGSTGISRYAYVCTNTPSLKVRLDRDGRTYGNPKHLIVEYYYDHENDRVKEREPVEDSELLQTLCE